MHIMLQQLDITLNQCYSSYYDNMHEKYSRNHLDQLYKKIQNRCDQLERLKILLNEDLSDEDFYRVAKDTYYFTFRKQRFFKTNVILNTGYDNLMIQVRTNSNYEFDINRCYTIEEIEDIFRNESILYEGVFISEDNEISNKSNFIECSDEELSEYYIRFKNLENIISKKNIDDVRKELTKDRIMKDYKYLLKLTETELGYLSRKYDEEIKLEL